MNTPTKLAKPAAALPIPVPAEKRDALRNLTTPPTIAWPTMLIWITTIAGIAASTAFTLNGQFPLWAGCVLNTMLMYPLFGVIHDSVHRSISSTQLLNDWMGRIGLNLLIPGASLSMFRWAHMLHHRFTGGPNDPDIYVHGKGWTLPFRWMTFDVGYLLHMIRRPDAMAKKHLTPTLLALAANVALLAAFSYAGYGAEALLLWLIPARMTMLIFGFVFFWLPHTLEGVNSEENLTLATNMRLGHEWLLGPLSQFQNHHLLHHLYPTAPPYRHPRIWKLMEPEIRKRDLAIQKGFAIYPEIRRGEVAA